MVMFDSALKMCRLCETATDDAHTYSIDNKSIYVCDSCWKVINAIIDEKRKEE